MKRPASRQIRLKTRRADSLKCSPTAKAVNKPSAKKRPASSLATLKVSLQAIMALPESIGFKILSCFNILSPADGDMFEVLTPYLKKLDPDVKRWESRMFVSHHRRTEKQLNKRIKRDAAEWNLNENALLKLPFEVRRSIFFHEQLKGVHEHIEKHGDSVLRKRPAKVDDSEDSDCFSNSDTESGTESENDADRQRRIQRMSPGKAKAVEVINDQLIKKGFYIIMLEEPYKQGDSVASITLSRILKKDHLLLPLEVGQRACRLSHSMRRLSLGWMGGGTSLGNELWDRYIHNANKAAASHVRARRFRPALAEMLGLLLFMDDNDDWLRDQEEYCDWSRFSGFFSTISSTWRCLLSQTSSVLGLVPRVGRGGGYRKQIETMLKKWEEQTNATLQEVFDDHIPDNSKRPAPNIRVKIF